MTRTFVAVDLGAEARAYLAREIARLSRALPSVRWTNPESLHLTLAFLGELDDERLALVEAAAREAARAVKPFALRVAGLGTFGRPHAPSVVWAGVSGNVRRLIALHEALAAGLEARGFPREARPFSPHLTLARLRAPLTAPELGRLTSLLGPAAKDSPPAEAPIAVDHIDVMKSELLRPAARYTCLRSVALDGGHDTAD
jgi:RNA 2',3'-cyclic 3'-phosphodiesterase